MTLTHEFKKLLSGHVVSVLSANPVVVAAFERDFEKTLPAFAEFARENKGSAILLQLGFEHETSEPAARLARSVSSFLSACPDARVVVMCNCPKEREAIGAHGIEVRCIHQNTFLDERRYRAMRREKIYDAAYVARLTPFKRHALIPVALAPRLLLMGTLTVHMRKSNGAYVDEMSARYAAARRVEYFRSVQVSELLASAKCGLALSAAEGACFASAEYFLCGLPVVDTPALGGRSVLYPEEFVKYVDASEEGVGDGIAHWAANVPDPTEVRAAWLKKVAPMRAAYADLMRELTGRDMPRFRHKLALRTPHPGHLYSLAIQAYLALKGAL